MSKQWQNHITKLGAIKLNFKKGTLINLKLTVCLIHKENNDILFQREIIKSEAGPEARVREAINFEFR